MCVVERERPVERHPLDRRGRDRAPSARRTPACARRAAAASSSRRWRRCGGPSSRSTELLPTSGSSSALALPAWSTSGSPVNTCLIRSGAGDQHERPESGEPRGERIAVAARAGVQPRQRALGEREQLDDAGRARAGWEGHAAPSVAAPVWAGSAPSIRWIGGGAATGGRGRRRRADQREPPHAGVGERRAPRPRATPTAPTSSTTRSSAPTAATRSTAPTATISWSSTTTATTRSGSAIRDPSLPGFARYACPSDARCATLAVLHPGVADRKSRARRKSRPALSAATSCDRCALDLHADSARSRIPSRNRWFVLCVGDHRPATVA